MKNNIKKFAILLTVLLAVVAIPIPIWASGEHEPDDMPDRTRDIIFIGDDCDTTGDHEYCDYTGGVYTTAVAVLHVGSTADGAVQMSIPGHEYVDFMAFSTESDIEFFVTAPEGRHFAPETNLHVSGGVQVTFGPFVRGCGRLFFVIAGNVGNNQPEAEPNIGIIFYTGDGLLPLGESGSLSGPAGLLVPGGPTPYPPRGYNFVGWQYNGARINFPFNAATDMMLEAVYERIPAGDAAGTTFTLTFRPTGGTMPPGEALSSSLPINTVLSQLPTPTREGHAFGGWMDGHRIVEMPVVLSSNTELSAIWVRLPDPSQNANAYTNTDTNTQATAVTQTTQTATITAIFDPSPGVFAAGENGLRPGTNGTVITNIPTPMLSGYIFVDWRLPGGNTHTGNLILTEDIRLTAIWVPVATPTPNPSPTPEATPAPTASPTPAPGNTGSLPNPQTNPVQISLMIFGTVMIAGIAAFSIIKIRRKHMAAADEYRSNVARYNREKRIMDLLDE